MRLGIHPTEYFIVKRKSDDKIFRHHPDLILSKDYLKVGMATDPKYWSLQRTHIEEFLR